MQQKQTAANQAEAGEIARRFTAARRSGGVVETYPGAKPQTLEEAYAIQDAAIGTWADEIVGWKVGRITGKDEAKFGVDRLAGPIFKASLKQADGVMETAVFENGFAAVEGEVVIVIGADAPAEKIEWSTEEARALIGAICAGVEIASSPFAGINAHGPLVTISDFGNNNGLIVGGEIPDWRRLAFSEWTCETFIDGASVGRETPAAIPGGPVESLRFLLELCARRGLPLKKGMAVSTGAVTGVHEIKVGQSSTVVFDGAEPIDVHITAFSKPA